MSKTKLSSRAKKALKLIPDYSKLYDVIETKDFVEIFVNRYGEACTFRVYNDNLVVER